MTSVGFGRHGEGRQGNVGAGPTVVITDLGVLRPDPVTHELNLVSVHPGVTVEQTVAATGWDLAVREPLEVSEPPTTAELATLRARRRAPARRIPEPGPSRLPAPPGIE